MTTYGATDLDMSTKTLVVDGEATKWVMVGKNGTWVKFHDGDKIQLNSDADIKLIRRDRPTLLVRSYNGTVHNEAQSVNTGTLALILATLALLAYKFIGK